MHLPLYLLASVLLAAGSRAAQCFNSRGAPWTFNPDRPIEGWVPCNATASVTNCCSPRDYCMSNGLCMDAVVENMITQQGCTSDKWDARPCRNYCAGIESDPNGFHFLWRCNGQSHCCSTNATTTCCNDRNVKTFVVEVGQLLHQPGMVAVSESVFANLNSLQSSSTNSGASGTSGNQAAATGTDADKSSSSSGTPQSLIIGLAIGCTLALLLIAALVFFALQFRRRSQAAEKASVAGSGSSVDQKHSSLEHIPQHSYSHFALQQQQHQPQHGNLGYGYAQQPHGQDFRSQPWQPTAAELGGRDTAELESKSTGSRY
ncbi:cell wall integrity and stress response component [Microdochium nivale]|nr:cell wall integrity and stress response component [Microdochium nivale]